MKKLGIVITTMVFGVTAIALSFLLFGGSTIGPAEELPGVAIEPSSATEAEAGTHDAALNGATPGVSTPTLNTPQRAE